MADVIFAPLHGNSTLDERLESLEAVLDSFDFGSRVRKKDRTAVKTHFGEKNNTTHIKPEMLRPVIARLKALDAEVFLTETSTLYRGERSNAVKHLRLAHAHGFTYEALGIPVIMADGLLGDSEIEVKIPGELYSSVNIARDAVLCDSMVILSHPTGHILSGIGACIKNLAMGLSSRKGKRQQHCMQNPKVLPDLCTFCRQCIRWCPEDAIVEKKGKAFILEAKCIGCGECIAVCRYDAVKEVFNTASSDIQKRMAEYALGAIIGKMDRCVYINMMIDMTGQCDCLGSRQKRIIPDVGILLSTDPVAIDQATLDLTREAAGEDLGRISQPELNPEYQLEHAEKIGAGIRNYRLVSLC